MLNDTIAAISTALQDGAISVIRISGPDSLAIAGRLFSRRVDDQPTHTVRYGYIIDPISKEAVDEVLLTVFRAPKTFTREDVVEISGHGGRYITRRILALVLAEGARLADPGEFTRRAFLNGRIDLTQAEAVMDMIDADSSQQAQLAIQGIRGSIRRLIEPLSEALLNIIANIEVNIDYPEYEDAEQLTWESVLPQARSWLIQMDEILQRAESGRIMKKGVKTVILGKPNVGKSSLLNALLEEDKAIVTEIAGTTRDLVEGEIHLRNVTLHLIDTAGIHQTEDRVEQIGIERSMKALEEAELILIVLDASRPQDDEDRRLLDLTEGRNRIVVINKKDLAPQAEDRSGTISICAAQNQIEPLIDQINQRYEHHHAMLELPSLANERQIALARQARQSMAQAVNALQDGAELDLVTIDLQAAYMALKEIVGETSREDLLDALFSKFCLGK